MKKPNLRKESISHFMLLHSEKLILGVCLALFGFFLWQGLGAKSELTKTPKQLLDEAGLAENYVNSDGAWSKLEGFRKGRDNIKESIVNKKPVDAKIFPGKINSGSPALALAKRSDPKILAPIDPVVRRLTNGVLMNFPKMNVPVSTLYEAPHKLTAGDRKNGRGARSRRDAGFDEFDLDGGDAGKSRKDRRSTADFEPLPELDGFGRTCVQVFEKTAQLRPPLMAFSPVEVKSAVFDVVCVTALVDFRQQLKEFENAFSSAIAYYPDRDRPVYQFLQVERRQVQGDRKSKWVDISESLSYKYPQRFPKAMHKMPQRMYASAPEVAAPENWDPVLTGPIPGFANFDYTELVLHPKLKNKREFPEFEKPEGNRDLGDMEEDDGMFDRSPKLDHSGHGRTGGADGMADANNILRRGTAFKPYEDELYDLRKRKTPGQYRLVRFFDLQAPRGRSFEYRMRVWVGDPNQRDPEDLFWKKRGSLIGYDGQIVAGVDDSGMGSMGIEGRNGKGLDGDRHLEIGPDGEPIEQADSKIYEEKPILPTMLRPEVRQRLAAGSDVMEEREKALELKYRENHFVSEAYGENPGELVKIEMPASDEKLKYVYTRYLRFARPSKWSEVVRAEADAPIADVFVGKSIAGRSVAIGGGNATGSFQVDESAVEIATAFWSRSMHAKLPAIRKVRAGETLDFDAPAYLLHPVTWRVLVANSDPERSGEGYGVKFRTSNVIVDALNGEQLDLPNVKKKAYETPTEVLVMDPTGKLSVANQFDQATQFRNTLFLPDDSPFVGKRRRKRKKVEDDMADDMDFGK